jgi:hypothetical protein
MRTTITIEEDVAKVIERLRKQRDATLKAIINEALRAGLATMMAESQPKGAPYRTRPVRLGAQMPNLDDISDVLAMSEGESHR